MEQAASCKLHLTITQCESNMSVAWTKMPSCRKTYAMPLLCPFTVGKGTPLYIEVDLSLGSCVSGTQAASSPALTIRKNLRVKAKDLSWQSCKIRSNPSNPIWVCNKVSAKHFWVQSLCTKSSWRLLRHMAHEHCGMALGVQNALWCFISSWCNDN